MSVTEFKRGVPTYKDNNDNEYGLLCETKEVCVTDNDGVSLEYKLQSHLEEISRLSSELQSCASEADLANYLPKSGGAASGSITISKNGACVISVEDTANSRQMGLLTTNGNCGLYDYNASKWVVQNKADGTNTFNGTASGNLPISGAVAKSTSGSNVAMTMQNMYRNDLCYVEYLGLDGTKFGRLGFANVDKPAFMTSNNAAIRELLHTGNSAKVVVSQTAPSDTSALWVW